MNQDTQNYTPKSFVEKSMKKVKQD